MRHILTIALLGLATSVLAAGPAKKTAKKTTTAAPTAVTLTTKSDSVSYTAGIAVTRGLDNYLQQQYGVSKEHMAAFTEGLRAALGHTTDQEYMARAAGAQVAKMLEGRMLPQIKGDFSQTDHPVDSAVFISGFLAALTGDTTVMAVKPAIDYFSAVTEADKRDRDALWKQVNADWLVENAKRDSVVTLPSGLQYKVLRQGTGAVATAEDEVTVKYEGTTIDGNVFDSSYKRNPQTATFRPDQVIKGWTEALTLMPVGSKWELYIPQELAYGERQAGPVIKPYSTLIFTVEVEGVNVGR